MTDTVIQADNLGKKYIIKHQVSERYTSLRDVMANKVKYITSRTLSPLSSKNKPSPTREEFWALKNVSFEVKHGDVIGVIGRNGAGKSTLLKILSRITEPTSGRIRIKGRVASLLEVGTGFHQELTGRENIFLNGAILGMSKAEIQNKFDEIVAFSEVEKFLDTPVKRYSSGMCVRLAFAVAAHLEPDILLCDEVLSVGDIEFQQKCLTKLGGISNEGRTVLLVSHNMSLITKLCDTAIWIDKGYVHLIGPAEKTVFTYLASGNKGANGKVVFENPDQEREVYASCIELRNGSDQTTSDFDVFSPIKLTISFHCRRYFPQLRLDVLISRIDGIVVFATTSLDYDSIQSSYEPGSYSAQLLIPGQFLAAGEYYLSVGLVEPNVKNYDLHESVLKLRVVGNPFRLARNLGFLVYPFEWKLLN